MQTERPENVQFFNCPHTKDILELPILATSDSHSIWWQLCRASLFQGKCVWYPWNELYTRSHGSLNQHYKANQRCQAISSCFFVPTSKHSQNGNNFDNDNILVARNLQVWAIRLLLGTLKGNAASHLQNFQLIGENFKVTWDLIEKRYGNKRCCLENTLEKLFKLKPLHSRNANDIAELLDSVSVSVRTFESLAFTTVSLNPFLVHSILSLRKLDPRTTESWKSSETSHDEFYAYNAWIKFF